MTLTPLEEAPPPENKKTTKPTSADKEELNNCSARIANALADAGVGIVYGGHGGALVPLVNAIADNPRLTWVCCRNEANASLMAAAHAKLTGNLACVIATSGPGATNLTTGLMEAVMDQVPVLALTGLKPRQSLHYSEFQDVDQSKLFSGGSVAFSFDVPSPEALIPLLRDAVATAVTKNTCAHLAIPVDVQAAPCPVNVKQPFCAAHAADRVAAAYGINDALIEHIAHDLSLVDTHHQERKRILIAVGLRAIESGPDILKLAEILHAPIVTRLDAKGCIDENHPLSLGVVGVHGKPGLEKAAALVETADIVLNFGVSDMTLLLCNTAGLQVRPMIEFEPTALMVSTRFRANFTCIGDLSEICKRLAEQLKLSLSLSSSQELGTGTPPPSSPLPGKHKAEHNNCDLDAEHHSCNTRSELASQVWAAVRRYSTDGQDNGGHDDDHHQQHRRRRRSSLAGRLMEKLAISEESVEVVKEQSASSTDGRPETTDPVFGHPADVLQAVSTIIKEDDVVCVDTGDVTLWAALCLTRKSGRTLSSERLGTMGYGLCAGIASCLATPNPSTSIVLVGDGGFQMTLNELATFQQCKHPGDRLIVLVFDNQLLGRVQFGFVDARGCELQGPDFAALAAAYGGQGHRVTSPSKARDLVQNAPPGLTILHIPVDPKIWAAMAAFKDGAITMMNSG